MGGAVIIGNNTRAGTTSRGHSYTHTERAVAESEMTRTGKSFEDTIADIKSGALSTEDFNFGSGTGARLEAETQEGRTAKFENPAFSTASRRGSARGRGSGAIESSTVGSRDPARKAERVAAGQQFTKSLFDSLLGGFFRSSASIDDRARDFVPIDDQLQSAERRRAQLHQNLESARERRSAAISAVNVGSEAPPSPNRARTASSRGSRRFNAPDFTSRALAGEFSQRGSGGQPTLPQGTALGGQANGGSLGASLFRKTLLGE
jgi:hypothetical protein